MVDPVNATNYNMTQNQLEEFILWWILASGKNGVVAARCLDSLLKAWPADSPFESIRSISNLAEEMKRHGIGCYNNKAKSFADLIQRDLDLRTCTADDLEKVRGIGPKTARCFLIHSRENQQYAGLDRHALSFLDDMGFRVPKATPTGDKYKRLERVFLLLCKKVNMKPSDLDLRIWNAYSGNKGKPEDVLSIFRNSID